MRKQSIEIASAGTTMLILAEKAFDVAIICLFKDVKETIFKN